MFQTFDNAKFPIFWKEDGENFYSYAKLIVNSAWFYADCKVTDGQETTTMTYLLSRSSQIEDLINNPSVTIRKIYLVSPPFINKTDSWSMSALAKVSVGQVTHEEHESNIEIYELAEESKYYFTTEVDDVELIKNLKVIYS